MRLRKRNDGRTANKHAFSMAAARQARMGTNKNTGRFNAVFGFGFLRVYLSRRSLDEGGFVVKMDIFPS
jgi:5-deoxy-D-glucuronate isomerase